jgi:dienelactone hydrolase
VRSLAAAYALIAISLMAAWRGSDHQVPQLAFSVKPQPALMDERLDIQVSGLPANRTIRIRAKSVAQDGLGWRSEASFISRSDGTIALNAQAPASGDYEGVDGMGLFWSMKPDSEPKRGDHSFFSTTDCTAPIITELEAWLGNQELASVKIERNYAWRGVHRLPIAEDGIVGVLYEPGDGRAHPGLIVLGGSEGGFSESEAAMFASRGFTALSLAYFGVDRLPPTLQKIPIEYFGRAIEWMRRRREVNGGFVGIYGASRGAEAALITAATYSVGAVIARSPSHVRWEGVTAGHFPGGPAWTFDGKPLSYVPNYIPFDFAASYVWNTVTGRPVQQTPLFLTDLTHCKDTGSAEIPVERIAGPVLLLSGRDDQIWPSSMMAARLIKRLRQGSRAYRDENITYDGVGHWLPLAYVPTRGLRQNMKLAIGGTPEGTANAQSDSWPRILRFLAEAFRGGNPEVDHIREAQ